jgi:membrane fusion protein, multidrug efflux system
MYRLRRYFAFVAVLSAGFGITHVSATARAEVATPVVVEEARSVQLRDELELSGTVTSPRVSKISTSVPGLVSAVHYDSGATVKTGDLLLELDAALEESALSQARAETAEAEAALRDALRRLGIAERLAKRSYGPQNTVDAVKSDVDMKRAALDRRKAQLAAAQERVDRHLVKAPYAGVISRRLAEAGQWIVPGTTVLELVDMMGLRIDVPVPQRYYPQLKIGTMVSASFDALPDTAVKARISALIPVSDPDARTFTLRALLEGPQLSITPGMSARVAINLQSDRKGVVVSRDALVRYPEGRATVWVIESKGDESLVKERDVTLGLAFEGLVHIKSGLKAGDRVVVRGNESLREGQAVRLAS